MAAKTESDIESDEEFEDELVGSGPFKVRSTGVFGQIRNQVQQEPFGSGRQASFDPAHTS